MRHPFHRPWWLLLSGLAAAGLITACGGGDGLIAAAGNGGATTVTGAAVKGPVANATVTLYAVNSAGVRGASLGTASTDARGSYSLTVPYKGDLLIEVTGGSYTDEASGATRPLTDTMRVMTTSGSEGGTITGIVTPLTTIAYSMAQRAGGGATVRNYGAALNSVGTQFQLGTVNLATTLPSVTGTLNAYGQALRGVSQYVQNGGSLATLMAWSTPGALQAGFQAAYNGINGTTLSFSFNENGVSIGGTGVGGGSGSCGVNVQGTVSTGGISVPLNLNYCISGIAAGSCNAGNSSLSQAVAGQGGAAGAVNLNYTYSPSCAAGAVTIALQ
ncbi:hypothetical protein [Variovorax terrae]|uniref:Carboxypeptidase regulatory-like domain-containing protein n=1 Tax=Variovorax terrae TaxID=2923278 RepID=A0A9X2APZ6_9BURK|nr:hypothetical protein [Variovorax terrae]MCJ0765844.1 hypothetical protein [Variovorax terrae]